MFGMNKRTVKVKYLEMKSERPKDWFTHGEKIE